MTSAERVAITNLLTMVKEKNRKILTNKVQQAASPHVAESMDITSSKYKNELYRYIGVNQSNQGKKPTMSGKQKSRLEELKAKYRR